MELLTQPQAAALIDWFGDERPGPLVAQHVALTGNGFCRVDRWPDPRTALVGTADNLTLTGDPDAIDPSDLRDVSGFLDAPESFAPLLRAAFPDLVVWDRVIYELVREPAAAAADGEVRRLGPEDAHHLWALSREAGWVAKTWGGPGGLAASGGAWGGFVEGRLVSVACVFFRGRRYEEIGVATEPGYRGRGLSSACVAGLCRDIIGRGRRPSWTTSPDNIASRRVAEKVGFTFRRDDVLYVAGIAVPEP